MKINGNFERICGEKFEKFWASLNSICEAFDVQLPQVTKILSITRVNLTKKKNEVPEFVHSSRV